MVDSSQPETVAEKQLAIYVIERAIQIQPETLQDAFQRKLFNAHLTTSGGIGPFNWTIAYGQLPGWLRIDPEMGNITGKPIQCGSFDFTVKVTDSANPVNMGLQAYHLKIHCDTKPLIPDDLNASGEIDLSDIIIALQIMTKMQGLDYFWPYLDKSIDLTDVLRIIKNME
ncbi:putative Ig [Candidatus Magnetomorum sp. HK-1]|nr:putative Ig [Candidatus Magnetomorum sp. HK-1]